MAAIVWIHYHSVLTFVLAMPTDTFLETPGFRDQRHSCLQSPRLGMQIAVSVCNPCLKLRILPKPSHFGHQGHGLYDVRLRYLHVGLAWNLQLS